MVAEHQHTGILQGVTRVGMVLYGKGVFERFFPDPLDLMTSLVHFRDVVDPVADIHAVTALTLFAALLDVHRQGPTLSCQGALMGGLLGPLLCMPFLPYPSGEGYVRLWSLPGAETASFGPGLAVIVIGVAFSAGALVAPEARRVARARAS